MSIRVKVVREKTYAQRVKYSGDGFFFHDLFVSGSALRQIFGGNIPDQLEFTITTPEEETPQERLERETDRDLRKNAWRIRDASPGHDARQ